MPAPSRTRPLITPRRVVAPPRRARRCGVARGGAGPGGGGGGGGGGGAPLGQADPAMLGVAAAPSLASNGSVYLYYSASKSGVGVNRVSRFAMDAASHVA